MEWGEHAVKSKNAEMARISGTQQHMASFKGKEVVIRPQGESLDERVTCDRTKGWDTNHDQDLFDPVPVRAGGHEKKKGEGHSKATSSREDLLLSKRKVQRVGGPIPRDVAKSRARHKGGCLWRHMSEGPLPMNSGGRMMRGTILVGRGPAAIPIAANHSFEDFRDQVTAEGNWEDYLAWVDDQLYSLRIRSREPR